MARGDSDDGTDEVPAEADEDKDDENGEWSLMCMCIMGRPLLPLVPCEADPCAAEFPVLLDRDVAVAAAAVFGVLIWL